MSWLFASQPPLPFQVWSDLEWNQDSPHLPGELLRPLTRLWFLLHLLGMLFLLALPPLLGICFHSLWSPLFPLHAPALILLSSTKVRLSPTFTISLLTIWYSGLTALFLFLLARAALAYLPTALSLTPRPLFLFQQAQYVQVFLLKPAPFCALFAGLGSTNKSAISLLISYLTLILSSPPFFLLPQSLWQIWQKLSSLFSCSIRLQWVPRHSFLPGNDVADELARRGVLLAPSAIPCSLSFVSTLIFSRTGNVLSHLNSSTHRFPPFLPRNLWSFVTLAVIFLIYAGTETAFNKFLPF